MMLRTVILGLAVAACWGSADTLATFVTRCLGTASTTLVAQVAGLVLAAGVALAVDLPTLSARELALSVLFGIVLGVVAALAYLTLYQALALGPLAIASPLVSGQGGVTLLLAVVLLHEALGGWLAVFLLVTFAGIVLSAINGHEVKRLALHTLLSPGVALSLLSMLCFGVFAFGLMQVATTTTWLLAVVWSRVFSCLFLSILLRSPAQQGTTDANSHRHLLAWIGAVGVGSLDVGGLLGLSFAGTSGAVGIVGMIASAYGVIPLCFGILVFRERPALTQIVGVAWLLVGLVGIATPSSPLSQLLFAISGTGTFILVLSWSGKRWFGRLAMRRVAQIIEPQAARILEPQSIVQKLREYAASGTAARLSPSVLLCRTVVNQADDPHAQAVEETVRLLAAAGFSILMDEEISFLETDNPSGDLSPLVNDTAMQDVTVRVTDAMSLLLPVAAAVRAVVVFPGGLSPLATLIEVMVAMQKGELAPAPLLLYSSATWQGLRDWLAQTFTETALLDLVQLSDDPVQIVSQIAANGADSYPAAHASLESGSTSIAAACS